MGVAGKISILKQKRFRNRRYTTKLSAPQRSGRRSVKVIFRGQMHTSIIIILLKANLRIYPIGHLNLPALVKIPLTEECKILPSPGIYAVSVETGSITYKGMTIIYRTQNKPSEVLLNIFDEMNSASNNKVTISFHKKIQVPWTFLMSEPYQKSILQKRRYRN